MSRWCLFVLLCAGVSAQQRVPNIPTERQGTETTIRVTDANGRPMERMIRVQVLGSGGFTIAEKFTDDQGQISVILNPGNYRLRITGPDIEEHNSERSFMISPRQPVHYEYVAVTKKPAPGSPQQTSMQPHVSAKALAIPDKASKEFAKGVEKLHKGELDDAERYIQRALERYPDYADAYNALGVISMKRGATADGRTYFQRAIDVDSEMPGGYVNLARVHMQEQAFPRAEELLGKALTLNPMDVEALSMQAFVQLMQKKFDAALANANRVHALPHAKYSMVHTVAASALQAKQLEREAIEEYKIFIQESPPGPSVERAKTSLQALEASLR